MSTHHHPSPGARPPSFWRSRYAVGFVVLGGIAAYFLLSEHRAHLFGALPFVLLLACPLLHVFMHRGHAGHAHGASGSGDPAPPAPPAPPQIGERS